MLFGIRSRYSILEKVSPREKLKVGDSTSLSSYCRLIFTDEWYVYMVNENSGCRTLFVASCCCFSSSKQNKVKEERVEKMTCLFIIFRRK